ncbi:MAG: hypothetical protein WC042_02845 [Candidatus Paceibacterota bacterium]|nr:hypothetical protein [Candidatus Paceibacterota bacterium]
MNKNTFLLIIIFLAVIFLSNCSVKNPNQDALFSKNQQFKMVVWEPETYTAEDVIAFAESQGIKIRPDQVGLGGICLLVPRD